MTGHHPYTHETDALSRLVVFVAAAAAACSACAVDFCGHHLLYVDKVRSTVCAKLKNTFSF